MANHNPSPATRFQKGNKLGGRPKGIIRSDDVQALMGRFWSMTQDELQAVVQNPKSTMGEIMVAAVMAKAAESGDYSRLAFLLDRTIGKVRDVAEVHQHNHDAEFDKEPKENVLELIRKMRGPKLESGA